MALGIALVRLYPTLAVRALIVVVGVAHATVNILTVNTFATVTICGGSLLDGFPRTLPQAEALDNILARNGEKVTATVSIMIPDSMIMERIKGRALKEGRADDASEDIINTRIVTYHNQTEPLIEYYIKAGLYHEIDGIGTIDEVRDRIFSVMDKF